MLFPHGKSSDGSFESSHYVERTRDGSLLHPSQYVIASAYYYYHYYYYGLCLRGSTTVRRAIRSNVREADFELDRCLAKI